MKKINLTSGLIIFAFIFALASCSGGGKKAVNETQTAEAASMEVSIGGMTCLGCEQTIQKNVGNLEGIKGVKASFTTGNAVIEYFPGMVDTLKIKEAITGSGYTVKKFTTSPQE